MASHNESSLRALEGLMTEFFDCQTSNERKREIEELLSNFSQQRDAWKQGLYFMTSSSNDYVVMYAMSVLETIINKQWIGLSGDAHIEIRGSLTHHLLTAHEHMALFLRNKLVKLIVDIGRLDWPHFYPDFFSSILQLVQQTNTASLGLVLLQTTSEELACPREDLSMARKDELHRLLLAQVPQVLHIINSILDSILEKHEQLVTATPPPSPTHGQPGESSLSRSPASLFSSASPPSDCLLSNLFKSPSQRVQTEALIPLDSSSHKLCLQALGCLAHLFSWIPLSTTITPQLLSTIFRFAAFGCDTNLTNVSSAGSGGQSLGVAAMCCVNELLSKNCVPAEFEDFLLQMFQQTFYLLQRITRTSNTHSSGNKLEQLDETYIEKFTEFLRLFVSIHLRRVESNQNFPVLEFLALLFKYTFKQPSNEGFFMCLDIWGVFLDYLQSKMDARQADTSSLINRYREALLSLVTHLLQKLQFRHNQSQLEAMDDENLDDDSETEWQHFLRECLETIAKVAELLPADTLQMLYENFLTNLEVYLGLQQLIRGSSPGSRSLQLNLSSETECRKLHCSMRDLSSLLQAHGRLAHFFSGEHFMNRFNEGHTLVDRLVQSLVYGCKVKLYEVDSIANNVLLADFVEVHAQAMAAVKAYAAWLAQFYVESRQHAEQQQKCDSMINSIVEAVLLLFHKQSPAKVVHSAAHLMLSLLTTVRPSYLLQLHSIQKLYSRASQGEFSELPQEVQFMIYRSISHYLLLPWPGLSDSEQDWATRASNHGNLIKQLTTSYCHLKDIPLADNKHLQEEAKPVVKKTLMLLTDLVDSIAQDGTHKSKQLCYQSLQDPIQVTLPIFSIYLHQPDVLDDMLGFYLSLFLGLRGQMGIPLTEHVIQTFISLFTREQLAETVMQESAAGNKVIEKFLSILQVIVREPASAFKVFLPHIITICMQQIYPIIAERPSPDIKPCLYQLLYELLYNNWRYFFKGSMIKAVIQTGCSSSHDEDMEHKDQFLAIMQSFGQSFLQPDIAVFRQNLEALENLNSRKKLYHKRIFCESMLPQFLNVLLQVLIHKSHDLLQDEIAITLYNMAAVDFDTFYSKFLPQFLAGCEGVDENQKAILSTNFKVDRDLPSFTQSVQRFVNDLRYYRLCNSSLPEGAVKF